MKALMTGAGGFTGSNICRALLERGESAKTAGIIPTFNRCRVDVLATYDSGGFS